MYLQFRQGIVRHQIDIAGTANFIRKSGNSGAFVDIICDNAPLLFTIAHGTANYLIEITKSVPNAWGPLAVTGQTQFLYCDISLLDASLTYGYTTSQPYVASTPLASPDLDHHWFDTSSNMMKVWNGTKWITKLRIFIGTYTDNALLIPRPIGTQVSLNTPCEAGNILLSAGNTPIRTGEGTFLTTESTLISSGTSAQSLRLEATQLFGAADEVIPQFSLVRFSGPKKIVRSQASFGMNAVNGIVLQNVFPGEITNVVDSGLVRNASWNFALTDINKTLYVGLNGELSLVPLHIPTYKVGYIYDVDAIIIQIQLLNDSSIAPPVINPITLTQGNGISIITTGDNSTIGLQTVPGIANTYETSASTITPLTFDSFGRLVSTNIPVDISIAWEKILSSPTTITGYGITDAYTKIQTDVLLDNKSDITHTHPAITSIDWSIILNTPTTIGGYGITDTYTITQSNNLLSQKSNTNHTHVFPDPTAIDWNILYNVPTNIQNYGITDAYTISQIDTLLAQKASITHTHPAITSVDWSIITNTPTTIAGYSITDAYTKTQSDLLLAGKSDINHTHPAVTSMDWSNILNIPTTVTGYGLTDAYTITQVNNLLLQKSNINHTHPELGTPPVTSVNTQIGDVIVNSIYQNNSSVTVTDSGIGNIVTIADGAIVQNSNLLSTTIGYSNNSLSWLNDFIPVSNLGLGENNIVVDSIGNIYKMTAAVTEGIDGCFLTKYNVNGVLQWYKFVNHPLYANPLKLLFDLQNNVLIAIFTYFSSYAYHLLQINPETGMQISELALPGKPASGLINYNISEMVLINSTNQNLYISQYDDNGINKLIKGTHSLTTISLDAVANLSSYYIKSLCVDTNSNVILIGDIADNTFQFLNAGIIKLDSTLQNVLFQVAVDSLSLPGGNSLLSVSVDSNNDVYILSNNPVDTFSITKLSGISGTVVWQKDLSSQSTILAGHSILPHRIVIVNNEIFVNFSVSGIPSNRGVIKLDTFGNIVWQRLFGLPGSFTYIFGNELQIKDNFIILASDSNILKYPVDGSILGFNANTNLTITDFDLSVSTGTYTIANDVYPVFSIDVVGNVEISDNTSFFVNHTTYSTNVKTFSIDTHQLILNSSINDSTGPGQIGQILTSNGAGLVPSWKTPIYDVHVDGTTILMTTHGLTLADKPQPEGPYYAVYVDQYGRVDGGITVNEMNWSNVYNTPTTLTGYGITNAYTKTEIDSFVIETSSNIILEDIDVSSNSVYYKTITGPVSFTFSNALISGRVSSFILELTDPGTNITWPVSVKWAGGIAPILTTTGVDILQFYTHDGGFTWRGLVLSLDNR